MLRITGYSDKYQAFPGEKIQFYVNSEKKENYDVQIVRLIHGDTNPEGPGYKEEEIGGNCNKSYQGRNQKVHGGSYAIIPQDDRLNAKSFTLQAYIFPTTPSKGRQGILTKWNEKTNSGYGLFIDEESCLSLSIGDGAGQVMKLSSEKKLMRKVWYLVAASYDADTGKIKLYQEPCVTPTNAGLGMSMLHPADETTAFVEATNNLKPRANDAPFLIAASTVNDRSGRHIHGGHYKEALTPIELPEQGFVYNGKIDRPRVSKKALSKSEIESLARGYSGCSAELRSEVIGAWDFHANISNNIASTHIIDTTSNHLNGFIVNLPV
jgi:N,N-dimethylformamidase